MASRNSGKYGKEKGNGGKQRKKREREPSGAGDCSRQKTPKKHQPQQAWQRKKQGLLGRGYPRRTRSLAEQQDDQCGLSKSGEEQGKRK